MKATSEVTLAVVAAVGGEPNPFKWESEWKALADEIEHQSMRLQECTANW